MGVVGPHQLFTLLLERGDVKNAIALWRVSGDLPHTSASIPRIQTEEEA